MVMTTAEAEALREKLWGYLIESGRVGHLERMTEQIALKHSHGSRVVGFRRRGYEVLLYEERQDKPNVLAIYEIDVDGTLRRVGTAWSGDAIRRGIHEHRQYLCWVASEWRLVVS